MAITESNYSETTVELSDVGAAVPDGATVDVRELTDHVLEIDRNGHTFTVEIGLYGIAEVTLRDQQRPERVPDWLAALLKARFDVREVRL